MKTLNFNRTTIGILAILSIVFLFSCQKENSLNNTETVTEEQAVQFSDESTQAEASFDDVEDISMTAADEESTSAEGYGRSAENWVPPRFDELRLKLGPCATITVLPNDSTYPKTIIIDFGDGCICRDGKFRKGSITLNFTKPLRVPGAVLTITLNNYYVNRVHIEGTKTITNLSAEGVLKYSVVVSDGKVTWPSGRGFKYEKVKVVTQVRGSETATVRDDVFSIEGRSKTTYASGITVTKNTETPLIKAVACNWISKGIVKIKINNRELFLDYGNGDCDNKATLKWNGHEREITLP